MSRLTKKQKILSALVVLLVMLVSGAGAYTWSQMSRESDLSSLSQVKDAISRHYVLLGDEEPALITVVDSSKVASGYLRGKVKNGDKILIYKNLQKVIIYRPEIDRIVDVGPAVIDTPNQTNNE